MNALGELIVLLIYSFLAIAFCLFLFLGLKKTNSVNRKTFLSLAAITGTMLLLLYGLQVKNQIAAEKDHTGNYFLSAYPNCESCKIVLMEGGRFEVMNGTTVVESGDWTFKSGGDYWIVYLNDGKDQLGSGDYRYASYELDNQ